MIDSLSIAASGVNIAATTTAQTVQLPRDSSGGRPRYVRVSATAAVYVKLGSASVSAVPGDLLVQPADSVLLIASGCNYISAVSLTGTANVSISPTDNGRWDTTDDAITLLRYYGDNAHVYLPGVGMLNGLSAANYIDSAGTQSGAVDQPVGLTLDAAGGLWVELVPNGFTGGTTNTGATIDGAGAVVMAGVAPGYAVFKDGLAMTAGKTYLFTVTHTGVTQNCQALFQGAGVADSIFGTGVTSGYLLAPAISNARIQINNNSASAVNGTVNVSVREVTGIHATQPTTASKPILRRGAVNLLLWSNDNTQGVFGPVSNASTSASSVSLNLANASYWYKDSATTFPIGAAITIFATVSSQTSQTVLVRAANSTSGGANESKANVLVTSAPQVVVLNATVTTASSFQVGIDNRASQGASNTAALSGVNISAIGVFQGTYTAAQIQALGGIPLTTTAPASTALGAHFWAFDGSNDSLSLGGPLFQMSDDHCVVVGYTANTINKWAFSHGGGSANFSSICSVGPNSQGYPQVYWKDDAAVAVHRTGPVIKTGIPTVVTGRKVGNAKDIKVDGVFIGSANSTAMGAATVSGANIGLYGNLNGGGEFLGSIYPVIAIKGTVTDPELLLLEKLVAQLSGITL